MAEEAGPELSPGMTPEHSPGMTPERSPGVTPELSPGMTMVGGAAASALRQRRPPLANLSHSKVMCFFRRLVSLGTSSRLPRVRACSFELFDRQVFKRWETAASTVSSQPWMEKPILNMCKDDK